MQYKVYDDTIVIRLDIKDEIITSIEKVCQKEEVKAATITGIGATNDAVVGVFKPESKQYFPVEFKEDMEITSLIGDVTTMDDKPYLHIHINLAKADGLAVGGHLNKAYISVTGEIFIRRLDGKINRKKCPVTGINIMDLD